MKLTTAGIFTLLFSVLLLRPCAAVESRELVALDADFNGRLALNGVTAEPVTVDGQHALEVRFGGRKAWSSIRFGAGTAFDLSDWTDYDVLSLTLSNPGTNTATASLRLDGTLNGRKKIHTFGEFAFPPGHRTVLNLGYTMGIVDGMRGQPRGILGKDERIVWPPNWWSLPPCSNVTSFQLSTGKTPRKQVLRIHRIVLRRIAPSELKPFVDRYGQFNGEEWPGKLRHDADFAERLAREETDIAARPVLPGRSKYGGWSGGPRLKATGRFRVTKHDGKWWFVDPSGCLFWSSGVTGLKAESGGPIRGGIHCYEWLPKPGDPLAAYRRKNRTVDFFKINLHRKYGPQFPRRFADISTRRLVSWGFNTIGNWSDTATWETQRVPYTIPVGYRCPGFSKRLHAHKTKYFPDIFSDKYAPAVAAGLAKYAAYKDDPWLLGVFIDNELMWNEAPRLALADDSGSATQAAVIGHLCQRYGSIEALNREWKTALVSWVGMRGGVMLNAAQLKAARHDLEYIRGMIAERYYKVCREQMNRHMPGCLYFGSRFSSYPESVVAQCAKHADVVCFNIYKDKPDEKEVDELATELDFPVIIGEYHFGALDRGMFHTGLRPAKDQAERASKFAGYLRAAAGAPWCVGAHWFQFRDQALTGRGDGENYNIGFVTVTDSPYPEMRTAARQVHGEIYSLRAH
jgi:hypothetical protein